MPTKDDLILLGLLLGLTVFPTVVLVGGGYELGRWYERKQVHQTTQQVCEECRAAGEKTGLGTCSDVLEKEDRNGNY